ncbi:hypothetical protein [Actinomadura macrotermitis]|uniref:Tat pathway signal sequence domain protein n=1 Tax=Actinomadura macrotermitis TaxID=2585200 RepID=A0A7K0C1J0_9ACTN|nr:hypothetical protein [Actinomadura macrotermitis]MQY07328.1 hypothetical protein [Actinomadura macrotermitis]
MPSPSLPSGTTSPRRFLARRALPAAVAAAVAPMALAAPAAHAATSTWHVTTTADARFNAAATDVTLRTATGATLFTCARTSQYGTVPSLTSTAASPVVVQTSAVTGECTDSSGVRSVVIGGTSAYGTIGYTATGYNATTGTTTLTAANTSGIPITVVFSTPDCQIVLTKLAATYTNSTHTLKLTRGTAGSVTAGCFGGTVKVGDALTLTGGFKLDQAVTITRTTA